MRYLGNPNVELYATRQGINVHAMMREAEMIYMIILALPLQLVNRTRPAATLNLDIPRLLAVYHPDGWTMIRPPLGGFNGPSPLATSPQMDEDEVPAKLSCTWKIPL